MIYCYFIVLINLASSNNFIVFSMVNKDIQWTWQLRAVAYNSS